VRQWGSFGPGKTNVGPDSLKILGKCVSSWPKKIWSIFWHMACSYPNQFTHLTVAEYRGHVPQSRNRASLTICLEPFTSQEESHDSAEGNDQY
jgi:hypothetical protein